MNILIVEDDENNIALFEAELASKCTAKFARSRDAAIAALKTDAFDLVLLDLRLPAQDGGLDSEINHGLDVHAYIQECSSGTPVVVFSAYGTVKLATKLAENSQRHDVWGCGQEEAMTLYREKTDFAECLSHIQRAIDHVEALSSVDISSGGQSLPLKNEEKRLLRIFGRLYGGTNIRVSLLGGGLSSAQTLRLELQDENAVTISKAVAKLGTIPLLRDEEARYQKCIAPALSVGGFAHLIKFLRAGAANTGGIFYGFAGDYQQSLLELLQANPAKAATVLAQLKQLEVNWQSNCSVRSASIAEIRRALIGDEDFQNSAGRLTFDWRSLEQRQSRFKWCCQHRDLHGMNVLVRDGDTPLLIDYGEVEPAPACLDPLILELSLLFHPACKAIRGPWPTLAQATAWANLDDYLSGTPLAPFIRESRTWAFSVEPLDKSVYATAYAYSVRQLKYADTDHGLAISIAKATHDAIVSN
ncbi:MAG: response regulator [Verrucomicrobiota bacterium]